ncbi:hypothetical protein C7999DRAFT_18557, partial [Corynascus novoguineensis]
FYRVQHQGSFTYYHDDELESRGHYCMDYCYWVNAKKLHQHLDWSNQSTEYSPFISVFDNKGKRAG